MILLLTTIENIETIQQLIDSEYRLNELVTVSAQSDTVPDILVGENIAVLPDWKNRQPPVLFPTIKYSPEALLGLVYTKLGNFEKACSLLTKTPSLLLVADLLSRLCNETIIDESLFTGSNIVSKNNLAIAAHYGVWNNEKDFDTVKLYYLNALNDTEDINNKAFTVKHFATLLTDMNLVEEAGAVLQNVLQENLSHQAVVGLKNALCTAWIKQLNVPYDKELLQKLKDYLWECLKYYEQQKREVDAAMVLSDAAYVATISNSFSEALGYVNSAIKIFDKHELPELVAEAQLKKAGLLKSWAQNDNPQFFRSAMQAYQEALKIFTRDTAPHIFADIQHQLGIVYAEIPDEVKKKGVWAAVSVAAFNEALNYFNKVDYPYEFATICNSQGNAYTKYPLALHSDNFDKALAWYREALDVQQADVYPFERSLTLLNYLNASWQVGNRADFNDERYQEMISKANEILSFSNDEAISNAAAGHIKKLNELKASLNSVSA